MDIDALVVLGAVMQWDPIRRRWEFPTIIQKYKGKLVMGWARALAAYELQDYSPLILVTGGCDIHPETGQKVSRADELAKLIIRWGTPSKKVIAISKQESGHTLGNVQNVVAYLKENPGLLAKKCLAILSPRFQLERARYMFDREPFFSEQGISLTWPTVEDVLIRRDDSYILRIEKIYSSDEAKTCQEMEEQGLKDLMSGSYKPQT